MATLDITEQSATVTKGTSVSQDPPVITVAKEQGQGQGGCEGKSRSCISALVILAVGNMATVQGKAPSQHNAADAVEIILRISLALLCGELLDIRARML